MLLRYPFPVGVDGFYYAQQIKSLLEHNVLYYPTRTKLVFYLIAGICGRNSDIVRCIKITSIAMEASLFAALWLLLWQLTRSSWHTMCATVIAAVLPSHLSLVADFTKELLCFALLTWSAVCIHAATLDRRRWLYIVAIVLLLMAALAHVSATLVILAFACGLVVLELSNEHRPLLGILVFLTWCTPLAASLIAPDSLLAGGYARFLSPTSITWWTADSLSVLVASAAYLTLRGGSSELEHVSISFFGTVAFLALCITVNPGLDHSSNLVLGRAAMTANLQLGLLVAGLLYRKKKEVPAYEMWPVCAVIAALALYSISSPIHVRGLDARYLSHRAQLVDLLSRTRIATGSAIVIAPQGDQFAVTYVTGISSQHRWRAGFHAPCYWLLFGAPKHADQATIDDGSADQRQYSLQSDISLRHEWNAYDAEVRARLIQNNPELSSAGFSE